ncbi:MAG: outer membrane lipoprotein-sorting protein [Bdellovibrionota bacterium]
MKFVPFTLAFLLLVTLPAVVGANEATALVEKVEANLDGKTFQGRMTMTVDRGGSQRKLTLRAWRRGRDQALVRILAPEKERGVGNLRLKLELWQYLPNVNRVIRIPPSMMLQSWMGSDFNNDDLVRASSLSKDYTHKIVGREKLDGTKAIKLELRAKPDAPVVWDRVVMWVRDPDAAPMKQEFYDERGTLVKVMTGSNIRAFAGHAIPTIVKMTNAKKTGQSTTIEYDAKTIAFDRALSEDLFTQINLRKPVTE